MSWKTILSLHGMDWVWKDIWYRLDWRKPTPSSIKQFLKENIAITRHLTAQGIIPAFSEKDHDKKILEILEYVINNFKYEIDSKRFGVVEKWQTVNETIHYGLGDCEDCSILIYCIARVNGISPAQIRLACGDVKIKSGTTGHCWVQYTADINMNWYNIDWCYHPSLDNFKNRKLAVADKNYIKIWFNITDFLA